MGRLTDQAKQAAVFEAAGYSGPQIQHVMDVAGKTITRWRGQKEYQELVALYRERHGEAIEPMINRIRVEMGDAVRKAVETLVENLDALTKDGRPNYNVRQGAAVALIQHAQLISGKGMTEGEEGGDGGQQSGPTTFVFNLDPGTDTAWRPEVKPPAIDAEVESEETVG